MSTTKTARILTRRAGINFAHVAEVYARNGRIIHCTAPYPAADAAERAARKWAADNGRAVR